MAQELIIIGTADAKEGDTLFSGGTKINNNFTQLFNDNIESTIVVTQANLSTTLGGTIDSTKVYVLDGIIDFSNTGLNITVPSGGVNILGFTFDVSKIICSDVNYTLFESAIGGSGDILGMDYAVEITGSGSRVYNLNDVSGFNAFEFSRINYNDCTSLGEIDGYRQGLESGTGRFGGTPELTLSGTWLGGYFIDTSIVRSLTNSAFTLFKAGTAFVMNSRFRSNQNIDLPALASFLDFAPGNFVNPSTLQLENCLITRNGVADASDTNLTPNIDATELVSDWSGNNGLSNTFVGGELSITAEATTTITTSLTTDPTAYVDLAGTYTPSDLQHFDEPSNGQLRHLGDSPREYRLLGQLVLDSTANNDIRMKPVIFRSASTTFEDGKTTTRVVNNLVGGRNVAYFTGIDNIILNKNDYVKIQVGNVSATNDITAELDSFFNIEGR